MKQYFFIVVAISAVLYGIAHLASIGKADVEASIAPMHAVNAVNDEALLALGAKN